MDTIYLDLGTPPWALCPGDLGFYSGDNLLERAIEDIEPGAQGNFVPSHVFILLSADHAVEADATGMVTVVAAGRYIAAGDHVRFFRPLADVTGDEKLAALRWLINTYAGRPYGYANLLGFAVQRLLGLKHNPIDSSSVCSQTAWLYLMHLRACLVDGIECEDCDPAKLYGWAVKASALA
ncbi:MAG: hypothetical protein KGI71_05550 [Patescibacteria group bacterium]|nr:hypothetical protein [Patescibacteria group bacterium]